MRKVLFLEWDSIGNAFIKKALESQGFVINVLPINREEDTRKSPVIAERIVRAVMEGEVEFVFSFNYFPIAAIACKACGKKYVSWVYDSPFVQLYSNTITYDTNYVFIFDKGTYEDLRGKGVETVYYLPMAAPVEYYDTLMPNEKQLKKYDADITMIGSMYSEEKNNLFRHLEKLDIYTKGYLDGLIQAQKQIYGYNFLEKALSPEIMKNVRKVCPLSVYPDSMETIEWTFANYFLARRVTALERQDIMSMLQDKYRVQLFTYEPTPKLEKVQNMGVVNNYTEAPIVFKCGRIHLNISLKSILTGIPLRAFDIMGCGGFLLSNFQSDFLDFFEPDEDFGYYESYEDLMEKVRYYVTHDDARERIARNGYEKVKAEHTYIHRIQTILDII